MLDSITLARKGAHTAGSREPITPWGRSFPQGVISGELARLASFSAPKNFFRRGTRALPPSGRATAPTLSLRIRTYDSRCRVMRRVPEWREGVRSASSVSPISEATSCVAISFEGSL